MLMVHLHGPKYVIHMKTVDKFEIDKPGNFNIFIYSGIFKINLSKRNFSEVIWKENIIEHLLKNIRRTIDYKIIFGPSADTLVKEVNLAGKTCLITGADGGIGSEITRCLNLRDCKVLMACRNVYKANQVANQVCEKIDLVTPYEINLASLASVKRCASRIIENEKQIDIILLNAATFGIPWTLTEDSFETTFQVNFLSQYYLLLCLAKILAPDVRVVITSSESHRNLKWVSSWPNIEDISLPKEKYTSIKSYNLSKLCGVLLMHYLSCQWKDTNKSIFCAHPGSFIKTGLCRNWWAYEALYTIMLPFSKTINQGASTVVYCATSSDLKGMTAVYFKNCKRCEESDVAKDLYMAFKLHDLVLDVLRERVTDFDNLINACT
ncbi:unnamed protein product, partial [Brenthis ino]